MVELRYGAGDTKVKTFYMLWFLAGVTGAVANIQESRIIQLEEKVYWLERQVKILNEGSGQEGKWPEADADLELIVKIRRHLEKCCGPMKEIK